MAAPGSAFLTLIPAPWLPSSAAVCRVIESCSTKRGLHVKNHQEFVPDSRHANRSISVKYFMVAVTRIRPFLGYLDAVPGRGSEGMSGIMLSNTFCSSTMIPLCSGWQSWLDNAADRHDIPPLSSVLLPRRPVITQSAPWSPADAAPCIH